MDRLRHLAFGTAGMLTYLIVEQLLCHDVAGKAGAAGDLALVADAATALQGLPGHAPVAGLVHRLCLEALAALGDADRARAQRLRAQRDASRNPWTRVAPPAAPAGDPKTLLLGLHAEHARLLHVDHVEERLGLAEEALGLADRYGVDETAAWGHLWRILALGQLGRRVELDADVAALAPAVARLDQSVWRSRLDLVHAGQRLLDRRFAECGAAAERAGGFFGLVMSSQVALHTGTSDVDVDVEAEVRGALDGLPLLARGWQAQLLLALDRVGGAGELWRHSSSTAGTCHRPYRNGSSPRPGTRPLRHRPASRRDAADARLPWVALVRLELARLADPAAPAGSDHLPVARDLADRLGMVPLAAAAADLAARRAMSRPGPLSPRETEIAACVSEGLSNRSIADRLHLSERTVENHVSQVLTKVSLPSRAAVAAWFARAADR